MTLDVSKYIQELDVLAVQLNTLLYEYFRLDDYEDLKEANPFERPILAVKKGFISRKGTFEQEKMIGYSFHGTGVSFQYDGLSISFEYYPVTESIRKPVFGIMNLFDFIESKNITLNLANKTQIENELNDLAKRGFLSFCYKGFSQYYIGE